MRQSERADVRRDFSPEQNRRKCALVLEQGTVSAVCWNTSNALSRTARLPLNENRHGVYAGVALSRTAQIHPNEIGATAAADIFSCVYCNNSYFEGASWYSCAGTPSFLLPGNVITALKRVFTLDREKKVCIIMHISDRGAAIMTRAGESVQRAVNPRKRGRCRNAGLSLEQPVLGVSRICCPLSHGNVECYRGCWFVARSFH